MSNPMNYITANRFYIEIDSAINAWFSECSGLGVTIDKEPYLEGGINNQQRILLKQAKFNDITLKRGMTDDLSFWNWISQVLNGAFNQRLTVNILTFNQGGERIQTWTLIGAIPVSWKAPSLQANSTAVAIEELVLAYEGLKVEKGRGESSNSSLSGLQRDTKGFYS